MANQIMDKEDKALSSFFVVLKTLGYVVAFAPLVLSIWVFHFSRARIQNGLAGSGSSGMEIAEPLVGQWMRFRSIGYLFYLVLIALVVMLLLFYIFTRNRHLKNVIRIFSTDTIIGVLLLTFSFAIGAYLTDIYLLLLSVVGL